MQKLSSSANPSTCPRATMSRRASPLALIVAVRRCSTPLLEPLFSSCSAVPRKATKRRSRPPSDWWKSSSRPTSSKCKSSRAWCWSRASTSRAPRRRSAPSSKYPRKRCESKKQFSKSRSAHQARRAFCPKEFFVVSPRGKRRRKNKCRARPNRSGSFWAQPDKTWVMNAWKLNGVPSSSGCSNWPASVNSSPLLDAVLCVVVQRELTFPAF